MEESEARGLIARGIGAEAGRGARFTGRRRGAVNSLRFFEWDGRALVVRRRMADVAFGYEPDLAKEAVVAAAWKARGGGAEAVIAAMRGALERPGPGLLPHGPALLAAGHGPRPWSIQQAVAGPALGEAAGDSGGEGPSDRAPEERAQDYRRLGARIADLHALPFGAFVDRFRELGGAPLDPAALFSRDLGRALAAAALPEALERALLRRARGGYAGARPALCHNDLHGLNVLRGGDGRLALIDWDNAAVRPPELDLVKLRHWTALDESGLLAPEPTLYAAFREGYEAARRASGAAAPEPQRLVACEILWLLRVLAYETRREAAGRPPAPPFPAARVYRARLEALAG